ncbi:DUF1490 domain-containing protein, partial [Dysosmobacter welbionis]
WAGPSSSPQGPPAGQTPGSAPAGCACPPPAGCIAWTHTGPASPDSRQRGSPDTTPPPCGRSHTGSETPVRSSLLLLSEGQLHRRAVGA